MIIKGTINIVFILLVLINCIYLIASINVKSSKITEKSTNVLGVEFDYALIDFELDQDLYRIRNVPCSNFDCTLPIINDTIDCSCDYTNMRECPKILDSSCDQSKCKVDFCDPIKYPSWETIKANKPKNFESTDYQPISIRYKANAFICEGIRIESTQNQGRYYITIVKDPLARFFRETPNISPDTFIQPAFCPSDNGFHFENSSLDIWNQDTYFLTITPQSKYINFNITIISKEIHPTSKLPSTTCTNLTDFPDHVCIVDGVAAVGKTIDANDLAYYTFQVTKPSLISFSAPTIFQDIDFFVSDDPSNSKPNYTNPSKWESIFEGDDYLILSLKPNSDGSPKTLYITVSTYYPSVYSFTVSTLTDTDLIPISNNYARGGAFSILGSSRLFLPNGSFYKCNRWSTCTTFSILFPFLESFPVWPIPTQFADDYRFNKITYYNDKSRKNHYSAAFLLSNTEGDFSQLNKDFNEILGSKIEFLNTLVDINGNALEGNFTLKLNNELECDNEKFKELLKEMDSLESTLYNNTDFAAVNSIIFNIDTLTLTDSWKACSDKASSFLQTNSLKVNKSLSTCSYSANDPEYDLDPCCNVTLSFFQCCQPKIVSVNELEFVGVFDNLVSDQCFSSQCTASVLNEYYNSLSVVSECDVPAFVSTNSALEMREALRDCKDVLESRECYKDSDCNGIYSDNNKTIACDLVKRVCMIPPEQLDLNYLECVFNRLPVSYIYSFLNKYGIQINGSLISNVLEVLSWDDCTSTYGRDYRSNYIYDATGIGTHYSCYQNKDCLDYSCETVHDVCFDGQIGGWRFTLNSNADTCDSIGLCQIDADCQWDDDEQTCIDKCNAIKEYCGYCSSNSTDCITFKDLDESQCKSPTVPNVCILSNGEVVYDVDPIDCENNHGSCNLPCGKECVGWGYSGCGVVLNETYYMNETTCEGIANATWSEYTEMCQLPNVTSKAQCVALIRDGLKYDWVDCESQPSDECYDFVFYQCNIQPIECNTKAECENAGQCSDSYFFSGENVPKYPENMGKCVRDHFAYLSGFNIPTCSAFEQSDSPMGCFSYYPESSRRVCNLPENKEKGFRWWSPATTREECEAPMGCKILDNSPYNLPYNFRFNQMTEELCNGCGNDSLNSWEHIFKWTPAVWEAGISVKPQWRTNEYIYPATVRKVLNYQQLYDELDDSVNTHIADLYRSEVLCRMERVEGNLRSISCSCSENGSPDCFSSSSLLLGQSKPCANEVSSYNFTFGVVEFSKKSVQSGCTSVLVSQVSKQLYKSTIPQTLSSNFVSYKKPDNYGILNDKGAIIGTILGDGITINTQGVSSLTICLQFNGTKYSKSYNVYDFAISTSNSPLRPLSVQTFTKNGGGELLCTLLTNFTDDQSFFPIIRINSWENQEKQVFDKVATGLIYTLGCIFIITALWGIFQVAVVVIKKYKGVEQIRLVHFLILIVTTFILIRAIYFFIIPSGALQNNSSADYILVVLPTFIYFTAFTIIISLWYMIVSAKDSGRTLFKRLKIIILSTNFVLYLLFVVIVLVFNYTENHPSNDCGTRIVLEVSSTTSQYVVSIVYAIIQAIISFVIGAAFIYLGGSLYLSMRSIKKNRDTGDSTNGGSSGGKNPSNHHQKKIFIVTFACSVGFIIHCVFVLILVAANPSNITFSFLGLIITEIIPSLSIFYCYNQGHFAGMKQSTKTAELDYITPSREEFNSSSRRVGESGLSYKNNSSHSTQSSFNSSSFRS